MSAVTGFVSAWPKEVAVVAVLSDLEGMEKEADALRLEAVDARAVDSLQLSVTDWELGVNGGADGNAAVYAKGAANGLGGDGVNTNFQFSSTGFTWAP